MSSSQNWSPALDSSQDLAGILSNANSRILDVRPDEPTEQLNLQDARERTEANVRTNAQESQDDYIDDVMAALRRRQGATPSRHGGMLISLPQGDAVAERATH